jgi:hypothetical protein
MQCVCFYQFTNLFIADYAFGRCLQVYPSTGSEDRYRWVFGTKCLQINGRTWRHVSRVMLYRQLILIHFTSVHSCFTFMWRASWYILCSCDVHCGIFYVHVTCIVVYFMFMWRASWYILCSCDVHCGIFYVHVTCIVVYFMFMWRALWYILCSCYVHHGIFL